jgi:hypothetical protein
MLSLSSLLNPAPPGLPLLHSRPSPDPSISPTTSFADEPALLRHSACKQKIAKDPNGFVKSKARGPINFPPFEDLDEASLLQIRKHRVYPFGKIQDECRRIPYNAGKRDFYEKTGRECFEGNYLSVH